MFFARTALKVVNRGRRKKVESIIRTASDGSSGADALCRHVKGIDQCRRILNSTRDKNLVGDGFPKETVKIDNGSSVVGAVLDGKNASATSRRQMKMSSPQNVIFSLQAVLKQTKHPLGTLQG